MGTRWENDRAQLLKNRKPGLIQRSVIGIRVIAKHQCSRLSQSSFLKGNQKQNSLALSRLLAEPSFLNAK